MTLSATAIINGLTMLRAYDSGIVVSVEWDAQADVDRLMVSGVSIEALHADDFRRMQSDGWAWNEESNGWELLQATP